MKSFSDCSVAVPPLGPLDAPDAAPILPLVPAALPGTEAPPVAVPETPPVVVTFPLEPCLDGVLPCATAPPPGFAHGQVMVVAVAGPDTAVPVLPAAGEVPSEPAPMELHGHVLAVGGVAGVMLPGVDVPGGVLGDDVAGEDVAGVVALGASPLGVVPGFVLGAELVLAPA